MLFRLSGQVNWPICQRTGGRCKSRTKVRGFQDDRCAKLTALGSQGGGADLERSLFVAFVGFFYKRATSAEVVAPRSFHCNTFVTPPFKVMSGSMRFFATANPLGNAFFIQSFLPTPIFPLRCLGLAQKLALLVALAFAHRRVGLWDPRLFELPKPGIGQTVGANQHRVQIHLTTMC